MVGTEHENNKQFLKKKKYKRNNNNNYNNMQFRKKKKICLIDACYQCFVDCCFSFCLFSLGHCFVCPSLIYGF